MTLDRLRKELEGLRADADFKTLQISKLASELNSKGDMGASLRVDHADLSKQVVSEREGNKVLRVDLD